MFDQKCYEALEREFDKNHIKEDVEEVLLDLAELLAEQEIMDKEVNLTESYGKAKISVWGVCTHEEDEISVFIKKIQVGGKEFEIADYLL